MTYTFDTFLAARYGVNEAIMLNNFIYWIAKNEANGKHFHDGRYWTYNSIAAMEKLYPFWSTSQIRTAIGSLVRQGVLLKGNYNEKPYDRTVWYGLTDDFLNSICQNTQFHLSDFANGIVENGKPIPDSKPTIKPSIDIDKGRSARFVPPTLEQVRAYCAERRNTISPEKFIDYYAANGWMVGKNHMKDWKAAVRNWEARDKDPDKTRRNYDPGNPANYRHLGKNDYYGESTL